MTISGAAKRAKVNSNHLNTLSLRLAVKGAARMSPRNIGIKRGMLNIRPSQCHHPKRLLWVATVFFLYSSRVMSANVVE
jgi:hypothetical protein